MKATKMKIDYIEKCFGGYAHFVQEAVAEETNEADETDQLFELDEEVADDDVALAEEAEDKPKGKPPSCEKLMKHKKKVEMGLKMLKFKLHVLSEKYEMFKKWGFTWGLKKVEKSMKA